MIRSYRENWFELFSVLNEIRRRSIEMVTRFIAITSRQRLKTLMKISPFNTFIGYYSIFAQ